MKKIKALIILASFFSLFLFQKTCAIGPEKTTDIFDYLDNKKEKFKYNEIIPPIQILRKTTKNQILLNNLIEFLKSSFDGETTDPAFNIKDIYFYSSTYENCLNKLFPVLNKKEILEYKIKYLTSLFIINKHALYNTYFNLYENLKNDLFSKVNIFLEKRTEENFLQMKNSFEKYNDIFKTDINSYEYIECMKKNFEVIKDYYYDIYHFLFPIDKILINVLIPQFLKIAYVYYLTFNFVLNKLDFKEQKTLKDKDIVPYDKFFTDKFIKEKNLKKISNSIEKFYSIEEVADNMSMNTHHIFF